VAASSAVSKVTKLAVAGLLPVASVCMVAAATPRPQAIASNGNAAYIGSAVLLGALLAYWAWLRHRRHVIARAAEAAIAQSEQRLSLALWGSGDELLDWNIETGTFVRQGGESGRETIVTEGMTSIDALSVLVHPDDFPAVREALRQHLANTLDHVETSYRARSRSGNWPWRLLRARVVARDANGKPLRMAGSQKDISRIKAVESELRELNEALDERVRERTGELVARQAEIEARQRDLEHANDQLNTMLDELRRTQTELVESEKMASLGRLVAGVAHEVNTPLGVGVTAVSVLMEQIGVIRTALLRHLNADEVDAIVAPIQQAGQLTQTNLQRAAELVKTFKQVAVDQTNPEFRTLGVREYLENTLQSLHPRLKRAGHRVELVGDAAVAMTGRPDVLYQIVVNLVMNSIVHAFPPGVVGNIVIAIECEATQLRLTYTDDGVGMAPAVASRVFEPFFTTSRGSGGTGLGMHIVYNLVTQALAGRITCTSMQGHGVRFVIVYPQIHPRCV
jgi:signal transduction histidine kinase